jgi:hypothetical protein
MWTSYTVALCRISLDQKEQIGTRTNHPSSNTTHASQYALAVRALERTGIDIIQEKHQRTARAKRLARRRAK